MQSEEYEIVRELAKKIVGKLAEKQYKISLAETITGGGITKEIIEVPGSSAVTDFSLIAYSNQSKVDFLNVPGTVLLQFGAVSEETAEAMVNGLQEISLANVCLAVSGIAGPGGATGSKPIGMVCAALKINEEIIKETWYLGDPGREKIIEETIRQNIGKQMKSTS